MKTKVIFLFLLFLAWMISSSSCEEKNFDVMPPETHSGKNTFGCYVNNELYVVIPSDLPFHSLNVDVTYSRNSGLLLFITQAVRFGTSEVGYGASMDLFLNNPKEGEYNLLTGATFEATRSDRDWSFLADINCGQVFITKFDTVNRIVSGTFEFTVRRASSFGYYGTNLSVTYKEESSTIVHATNGRFDVQLTLSE